MCVPPISHTEHQEGPSLSFTRRALLALTALTLAAFTFVGCESGPPQPSPTLAVAPTIARCNLNPRAGSDCGTFPKARAHCHTSSVALRYFDAYPYASTGFHAGTNTCSCAGAYSQSNSSPHPGGHARTHA